MAVNVVADLFALVAEHAIPFVGSRCTSSGRLLLAKAGDAFRADQPGGPRHNNGIHCFFFFTRFTKLTSSFPEIWVFVICPPKKRVAKARLKQVTNRALRLPQVSHPKR